MKFQLQSQAYNTFLIQNQIPYIPHLQSNRNPTVRLTVMPATTSSIELWPQDEISTIFIVGFPDNMSVSILYGYNPSTELCPGTQNAVSHIGSELAQRGSHVCTGCNYVHC